MRIQSFVRFGFGALVGGVASLIGVAEAHAASTCDPASLTCSIGTAGALTSKITKKLATDIDSGWMEKGPIKVRTHFSIDPVGSDPVASIAMNKGALLEASWPEKGFISLRPFTAAQGADGAVAIHYTLTPSLDASIYGISVSYDATTLVNMIPGASFHYDSQGSAAMAPWGFAGAPVTTPVPSLDQSTIFSIPFSDLGVDPGIAEGSLSIQAAAKPTFTYKTKEVRLDSGSVTAADGSAKLAVMDGDSMDVTAYVTGEVALTGSLDVRPVVQIDTVDGIDTYGLVKYSFSAVSKDIGGMPATSATFDRATIHIPLPNLKVPSTPLDMGTATQGQQSSKKVTLDSTGEMDAQITVESSDPQFTVPSGQIRVTSKSKYDLEVVFKGSGGPASADITVHSNDPDSPDQVFHVAANGAALNPSDPSSPASGESSQLGDPPTASNSGCSASGTTTNGLGGLGALGIGLGLALVARRRRSA